MDTKPPMFQVVAPTTPAVPDDKTARIASLENALQGVGDQLTRTMADLDQAKAILKDLVAAGVLTDGFMTMAVGQSLLNQAETAKQFLADHP